MLSRDVQERWGNRFAAVNQGTVGTLITNGCDIEEKGFTALEVGVVNKRI